MLGIYEKRYFSDGDKLWYGRYSDLVNVLHWHLECELIRVVAGRAKIKIGEACYDALSGDSFFCPGEELHYIISEPGAQVDIAIFSDDLVADITSKYTVTESKLPKNIPVKDFFDNVKKELQQKGPFFREAIENLARGMIIDIFRHCQIDPCREKASLHKTLITKINNDFAFITFEEAVRHSGYSASHFSKVFKRLTGMRFSEYLNVIKVENAIMLLRDGKATMTAVSRKCGFSTIRNFNRVFKKVTGYSPRLLPKDFIIDTGLHVSKTESFDPTDKASVLM